MLGLLYKDIKVNRSNLLITMAVVLFFSITPIAGDMLSGKDAGAGDGSRIYYFIYFFLYGMSFIIVGMMASNLLSGDERKKWGYFTASVPGGIKKQVASCYILVFLSIVLTLGYTVIANFLTRKLLSETVPDVSGMMALIALVVLFFRAIELPFFFAFGSKTGSFVKTLLVVLLILFVSIYFMFADLSWLGSEDSVMEGLFKFIEKLDIRHILSLGTFGRLILLAVPGYIVSWGISTKVYLKGVERFEK